MSGTKKGTKCIHMILWSTKSSAGVSKFLSEDNISYYTSVQEQNILRNVIVSGCVTFSGSTESINFW